MISVTPIGSPSLPRQTEHTGDDVSMLSIRANRKVTAIISLLQRDDKG
jgi:hypothetical protein